MIQRKKRCFCDIFDTDSVLCRVIIPWPSHILLVCTYHCERRKQTCLYIIKTERNVTYVKTLKYNVQTCRSLWKLCIGVLQVTGLSKVETMSIADQSLNEDLREAVTWRSQDVPSSPPRAGQWPGHLQVGDNQSSGDWSLNQWSVQSPGHQFKQTVDRVVGKKGCMIDSMTDQTFGSEWILVLNTLRRHHPKGLMKVS